MKVLWHHSLVPSFVLSHFFFKPRKKDITKEGICACIQKA